MTALLRALAVVVAVAATGLAHAQSFIDVTLSVDVAAGVAEGEARAADGSVTPIRIARPPLGGAADPFNGYIGPDDALLPPEAGWLPFLPDGSAGWRIRVETRDGFVAAPYPGGAVERTDDGAAVATFELTPETARAPLIVGRFEIGEARVGDVTLRTFFTAANAAQSDAYLAAAGEAVETLAARIGPYPYEAFSVVESPLPVGLGYPGFTLVSGRILPYPFMRGRSLWHEISHVWWGNGVFVDYGSGNWAEGFAAFFADYALAEREGAEAAREARYDWLLEYDAVAGGPADIPLRAFVSKSHGQDQSVGYGKAAMVLVMLRDRLGEAAFDAGVKRFWRDNRFRRAGWADIQVAFETESGADLDAFFARWLDDAGAAPPDPADEEFRVFRRLAPNEHIATLRLALKAEALDIRPLAGAPGDAAAIAGALGRLAPAGEGGLPTLVGDRAALAAATGHAPPEEGPALWAARDGEGRDVLAVAASDLNEVAALAARARHYGRWSWIVLQPTGRAARGRWPISD